MVVFAISGWSGAGKSTVISGLVKYFVRCGKKALVIKKIHGDCALQPQAKDSVLFLDSGASQVYVISDREVLISRRIRANENVLAALRKQWKGYDVVLLEGTFDTAFPAVEIYDPHVNPALKIRHSALKAVVSPVQTGLDLPHFSRDDIEKIAAFMEAYYAESGNT